MTTQEILKSDVLDILFEHRNKLYGAYALRRNYNSRLVLALIAGLIGILLLSFFLQNSSPDKDTKRAVISGPVTTIDLKTEQKEEKVVPKKEVEKAVIKVVAKQKFVNQIKIVPNEELKKTDVPANTDLQIALISDKVEKGEAVIDAHQPIVTKAITGTGENTETTKEADFEPEERAAEFPGGQKAWLDFLSRNLNTPSELQAGERKTVLVRFLVNAEGKVTNFEIIQSAGTAFDTEVIRVLRKMPYWMPAIQNGHTRAVSFTQPITFVGVEE